jgi:aryl-alcohol dehydrogenase-like predicted oxidoreductase
MKLAQIQGTDLEVSRITLGTWAIGGSHWGERDDAQASAAIEAAIGEGINIIDTAPAYGSGHAEELIGRAIKGRRDKIIIATKCGLEIDNGFRNNLSPVSMEKELDDSLRRLDTDYIDLYQCHWPDPNTPIDESMQAMLRFRDEGKIRHIGLCNFDGPQLLECLRHAKIATLQPHYSLLERGIEGGVQQTCVGNGVSIIPYAPLGGGMLTGKYTEPPTFRKDDARSFFYRFFQKRYWPGVKALLDVMRDIAAAKNAKVSHVAIAWLLARPGVVTVLAGARNPEQVKENTGGLGVTLSADEITLLDSVSAKVYQQD